MKEKKVAEKTETQRLKENKLFQILNPVFNEKHCSIDWKQKVVENLKPSGWKQKTVISAVELIRKLKVDKNVNQISTNSEVEQSLNLRKKLYFLFQLHRV